MGKIIRDLAPTRKRLDSDTVVQALSAEDFGVHIDTRGGPLSLFALREQLIKQLHSTGGRPSLGRNLPRYKIPMLPEDWNKLKILAELCNEKIRISPSCEATPIINPSHIASLIVHEALMKYPKQNL